MLVPMENGDGAVAFIVAIDCWCFNDRKGPVGYLWRQATVKMFWSEFEKAKIINNDANFHLPTR